MMMKAVHTRDAQLFLTYFYLEIYYIYHKKI